MAQSALTPVAALFKGTPFSFAGVTMIIERIEVKGGIREFTHEVNKRPGGKSERSGRKLYTFGIHSVFDVAAPTQYGGADNWPNRLAQLRFLFESQRVDDLVLPHIGTIKAFCTNWSQVLEHSVQSGERAAFEFKEDATTVALAPISADEAVSSVASSAEDVASIRAKLRAAGDPDPTAAGLLDGIAAAVTALLAFRDQAELAGNLIAARLEGIMSLCEQAAACVTFQDTKNWYAYDVLAQLWYAVVVASRDLLQKGSPIRHFATDKTYSIVELSTRLYQDATHCVELLQLNGFDDALAIRPGTDVVYYDAGT